MSTGDDTKQLAMPTTFISGAQKRGWNVLNFRVSQNHVVLIQDNWRMSFVQTNEKKFWHLDRYGNEGWNRVHTLHHPGTSRLEWVQVTFGKLINHLERLPDGESSDE